MRYEIRGRIPMSRDIYLTQCVGRGRGNCHRCVVINQRHHNVLEYKESSYCEDKNTLENLCSLIPGDANLYSLFKIDAQPIVCPFKGPYTFTYNRGHGLCKNPVSHVDTCTEPSRLLLRYQACPDVPKSESYEEELQCLAQWRDSTYHYLVGKLNYRLAVSNEERYRCFIYETLKSHTIVKIAVSGDATCSGLASPYEGAKILTFTKGGSKCKFPNWVSSHHWHSLDGKLSVKTNHKNSTMHIMDNSARDSGTSSSSSSSSAMPSSSSSSSSLGHHHHHLHNTNPGVGGGIYNSGNFGNSVTSFGIGNPYSLFSGGTRITCQASKELSDDHVAVVAQHTEGCTSTTVCMHFYKRDSHVIELQIRKKGSGYYDDSDECGKPEAFGPNLPYVTLIRAEVNSHRCPYLGKYMTTGVTQDGRLFAGGVDLCMSSGTNSGASNVAQSHQHGAFHSVVVGCGQRATMDFHSKCVSQEPITSYECHGSWEENGTGFLIASPLSRSSTSASRFCFTYLETEEDGPPGLQFFSSSESCRRDVSPNVEGIWAFNLTVDGQCAEPMTGGAARSTQYCDLYSSPSYFLAILVLLTFYTSSFSNITITTTTTVSMSNTSTATTTTNISTLVSDLFYSMFAKILSFSSSLSSSSRRISSSTTSTSLLTSHNRHHHPDPNPTRQQPQQQHHSSRRMTLA